MDSKAPGCIVQAARESEDGCYYKELRAIMDHSFDGIWIVGADGVVEQISESCVTHFNMSPENILGRHVESFKKQGGLGVESAAYEAFVSKKCVTLAHKTLNGKNVVATATPIFDKNNKLWKILTNIRDISEGTTMITEIERYRQELTYTRLVPSLSPDIVGESDAMKEVLRTASLIKNVNCPTMLIGETGTGWQNISIRSATGPPALLLRSTAPQSRKACWKASCSGMSAAASPGPFSRARWDFLRWRTRGRCFSTRSTACR
jgi:transcriptional regulator with PAS, ATPase and Fis domain